jgi:hypothetical protein
MTKPSSSDASESSCGSSAGPPTPEEIARIIRLLREAGARVVNARGEDFTQRDLEDLLKEIS